MERNKGDGVLNPVGQATGWLGGQLVVDGRRFMTELALT